MNNEKMLELIKRLDESVNTYNVNLKLPKLILTKDYHDFEYISYILNSLDLNVTVEEVGNNMRDGKYVGVVYVTNKKPSEEDIQKLMKDKNIIV